MNNLYLDADKDSFSRNVAISFALHAAIAGVLLIRTALFPSEALDLRTAIRVDVVGLPDKVTEPQPPAPPSSEKASTAKPEKSKPETPPKVAPVPTKTAPSADAKEAQRRALERLKAMQAIENIKNEVAENEPSPAAANKPQTYRGNALSAGSSLTGLERIDFDRYFSSLEEAVKSNWRLPGWLSQAQLRAQALVLIDEAGGIIRRQIVTSSGNEVFDGQVLEAIDRAAPFPQPPDRLKDVIALRGIVLNFPE